MDALMETTCFNVIALEPPKQLAASVLLQKQEKKKKKKKIGQGVSQDTPRWNVQ